MPDAVIGALQAQGGMRVQEGDGFGVTIADRQAFNWTRERRA